MAGSMEMRQIRQEKIFYSEAVFEGIARQVLCGYDARLYFGPPQAVPVEEIIEAQGLLLEYQYIRKDGRILGKTIFEDGVDAVWDMDERKYTVFPVKAGTIFIDASLCEEESNLGRLRFTCAHELAHWLLHKSLFDELSADTDVELMTEEYGLEVQANMLASALLMPMPQIKKGFYRFYTEGIHRRVEVIERMAALFQVSYQAMRIRLEKHKLL